MDEHDGAVIFPEGMVVTPGRRARGAANGSRRRDPERAERLRELHTLAPVRPAGTAALLRGAPDADVVIVTHTGLEVLARIGDAPAHIPLPGPVRISLRRFPRAEVPGGDEFATWLDERWLDADAAVTRRGGAAASS